MKPTSISLMRASDLLRISYPQACLAADTGAHGFPPRLRGVAGPPSRMVSVDGLRKWCTKTHRKAAVKRLDAWVDSYEC